MNISDIRTIAIKTITKILVMISNTHREAYLAGYTDAMSEIEKYAHRRFARGPK